MCLCGKVGTVWITVSCKGGTVSTAECPKVLETAGWAFEEHTESGGRFGVLAEGELKLMLSVPGQTLPGIES